MEPLSSRPPTVEGFVLGHRPALDGLRGLAVLAVIAHHTIVLSGGFLGVDLFFVLSGFLITALLLQEQRRTGRISLPCFYLRRCLRLLPALLALLAAVWVGTRLWPAWGGGNVLRKDSAAILLYYYNWRLALALQAQHTAGLCHLWSLSVEEQFYLLWPAAVVLLLALGARRRWLLALVLAGITGPALLRWAHLQAGHDPRQPLWYWRLYGCSDMRADALSAGCLVGLLASWGMLPTRGWGRRILTAAGWLAAASLAIHLRKALPPSFSLYVYRWGFTVVALSAAVLVAALVAAPPWPLARLLESRPLGWVGRVSYGTYLWHMPILLVFSRWPVYLKKPGVLVIWGVSLAAGALSHYCVERPFLRLKQRLDRHDGSAGTQRPPQPLQAAA